MNFKYRIDFYFWSCDSGFSHIKTINHSNLYITAKEYVNNINIDYFTEIPYAYDAIMVRTVDNENDYVLSEYWWNIK